MRTNPERPLRARGNLQYMEFVRLVGRIWDEAHPDIPYLPAGNNESSRYPAIYYSLDLRRAHPSEPKPKYRETVEDSDGKHYVITAQRFQNVVKFLSVTESSTADAGSDLASEIIEMFEDFMLEFTPVFKELGASELTYSRRFSDSEENRSGAGVVKRALAYLLTTEKVRKVQYHTLDEISINARVWLDEYRQSTHIQDFGGLYDDQPRYFLSGANPYLTFSVKVDDQVDHQLASTIVADIPFTNFKPGDIVHLNNFAGDVFPDGMSVGLYQIITPTQEESFVASKSYVVSKVTDDENSDPISIDSDGSGLAFFVPSSIESTIVDEMGTKI